MYFFVGLCSIKRRYDCRAKIVSFYVVGRLNKGRLKNVGKSWATLVSRKFLFLFSMVSGSTALCVICRRFSSPTSLRLSSQPFVSERNWPITTAPGRTRSLAKQNYTIYRHRCHFLNAIVNRGSLRFSPRPFISSSLSFYFFIQCITLSYEYFPL